MNTRRTFATWTLVLGLSFWFSSSLGHAAPQTQSLVPATFAERQDSQGFGWRLMQNGSLANDSRGCLANAMNMSVNGVQLNFNQQQMTADGSLYVFSGGQAQRLEVSRRVGLDFKQGIVQFVDTFKNPTSGTLTITVNLATRTSNQAQAIVTDQGAMLGSSLGPKESGFLAVAQPGMPSPLFFLGGAKAKVRPTISNQNNFQFVFAYLVTVPAGKTVSIVTGIAQRNVATAPDPKTLATMFKPFRDSAWMREVPGTLRSTIVNGPSSGGFDFGDPLDMPDAVAELGVSRGPYDMLLIGEETRLRGTLVCDELSIRTGRGAQKLPLEKIVAILGGNQRGRVNRVILRDGQVFVGALSASELTFTLNSGLEVTCSLASVDRFVLREQPGDGQPGPEVFAYVDLPSGDRLAAVAGETQKLTALTAWGARSVPLNDLQLWSVAGPSQGTAGHRLVLADGSSFMAFVSDGSLKLSTSHHGLQEFEVLEIQRMRAAHYKTSNADRGRPDVPHAILAGGNLFVCQADLPVLHFVSQGQIIPVAPPQIKLLKRYESDDAPANSDQLLFQADLWDGDVVVGSLSEETLPLRTGGDVLQVPLSDLVELRVPTPTVPESLRSRITELLADLSNVDWKRREAATKELMALGAVAVEQYRETLEQTTDPEVRKRVQALLDAAKE